jgi:hypothetical protein
MGLPEQVAANVVRRIFDDMRTLGWASLPDEDKTRQYNAWAEREDVGKIIIQFNADPRHWIKDGPVKEWPRASVGVGSYAKYLTPDTNQVDRIVHRVLGPDWSAEPASMKIKPLRVTAHCSDEDRDPVVVTWAPAKDFKHLLWAAVIEQAKGDPHDWMLVAWGSLENPIPADLKTLHQRIAKRCGLKVEHIQL